MDTGSGLNSSLRSAADKVANETRPHLRSCCILKREDKMVCSQMQCAEVAFARFLQVDIGHLRIRHKSIEIPLTHRYLHALDTRIASILEDGPGGTIIAKMVVSSQATLTSTHDADVRVTRGTCEVHNIIQEYTSIYGQYIYLELYDTLRAGRYSH